MKKYFFFILIFIFWVNTVSAQKNSFPERPKLVITIVIEQMRYDFLSRYWNKFGDDGFKRLIGEGTSCTDANYNYLLTQSAAGYASIATGTEPSQHGIIGDKWYERLKKNIKYCTFDQNTKSVGTNSVSGQMSPYELLCTTLGDELRISNFKQSKVIGISPKDYAAILPAGHLGNAAYWLDPTTGNWISSSYYQQILPDWVQRFNEKKFPDVYLQKDWTTFLPIEKYTESLNDNNSYEKGFRGGKTTFPYSLTELFQKAGNYDILNYTPFGNIYTKDFAISAIVNEDLGKDDCTDFLSIGFSACGNVNTLFGIRSVETEDMYIRLDQDLGFFLNFVNDYVGLNNTLIIVTSDRGVSDSPEFLHDIKIPSGTFNAGSGMYLLNSYLRALYGQGDWVQAFFDQQIYLNRDLIEDSKLSLTGIQQQIASFMVGFEDITSAMASSTFDTQNFTHGMIQKAQNSYNQKRSGDVILNLAPGRNIIYSDSQDALPVRFSAYSNDTHVPLIWFGWKIKHSIIDFPVSLSDVAPTLSGMLKIAFPNASTGTPIHGIIQP
jgi:hypothetical protein